MKIARVLIADDQELIREGLEDLLEPVETISVIGSAENGREAMALAAELEPDVILMDIRMPVLDGVEAAKQIKINRPNIKVIMFTTFKDIEYVTEALSFGAEGYLLKAIDPEDLIAAIHLISHGGTLISKEIAQLLITNIHSSKTADANTQSSYSLSPREIEVLALVAEGLNNQEIASELFLSQGTVKNYISAIYSKLETSDRIKAANKAKREGLI